MGTLLLGNEMIIEAKRPNETASSYALRVLKENIISLDLAPGSTVSENEIASLLGISRTPVREALSELSRVGIVEVMPQKGSRISLIDYSMVEQSRFLRLVLEREVVRLICRSEVDLSSLEENLRLQSFYLEHHKPDKLLELDNQFHALLYVLSDKMHLYSWMMEDLTIHFDRVRQMSLIAVKDLKIVSDHEALCEAMKARDEDLAAQLVEKHLSRYKLDEQVIRQTYPDYFR